MDIKGKIEELEKVKKDLAREAQRLQARVGEVNRAFERYDAQLEILREIDASPSEILRGARPI